MYQADSVTDISRRYRSNFRAELFGSKPWIWPGTLPIFIKVLAQADRGLQLAIEWLHRQYFTSLADAEYLVLHAQEVGLTPLPAQFAAGSIDIVTVVGTIIPNGTQFISDGGVIFESVGDVTATTTLTSIMVRATPGYVGEIGNLDPAAPLTLLAIIDGVGDIVVSDSGIVGGEEAESDDSLRDRILYRKRNPPRGGAPSEYIEWSKSKPGVTRVWVQRATPSAGSVTIYFTMDNTYINGIPAAADVSDLLSLLNTLAPADAKVIVTAPTQLTVNVEVTNLTPDTPIIREGVLRELQTMFLRKAEPGAVFSRDWLSEAISSVPGWRRHKITGPADDITPAAGELPILGTLTFI